MPEPRFFDATAFNAQLAAKEMMMVRAQRLSLLQVNPNPNPHPNPNPNPNPSLTLTLTLILTLTLTLTRTCTPRWCVSWARSRRRPWRPPPDRTGDKQLPAGKTGQVVLDSARHVWLFCSRRKTCMRRDCTRSLFAGSSAFVK